MVRDEMGLRVMVFMHMGLICVEVSQYTFLALLYVREIKCF